jgi:hypothetical protein
MDQKTGVKLPVALRDVIQRDAYIFSLKKYTLSEIQVALSQKHQITVSIHTLCRLVKAQRAVERDRMDDIEVADRVGEFVGTNDEVIRDAWKRLAFIPVESASAPALLNTILKASEGTAKILGLLDERLRVVGADGGPVVVKQVFDVDHYIEQRRSLPGGTSGPRLLGANGSDESVDTPHPNGKTG